MILFLAVAFAVAAAAVGLLVTFANMMSDAPGVKGSYQWAIVLAVVSAALFAAWWRT